MVFAPGSCYSPPRPPDPTAAVTFDWAACGPYAASLDGPPSVIVTELSRAMSYGWQPFQFVENYTDMLIVRYPDTPCREGDRWTTGQQQRQEIHK